MFEKIGDIVTKQGFKSYFSLKRESPIEDKMVSALMYFEADIDTQVEIGKYRVDILLEKYKIIVECDGEEFHRDRERERKRDDFLNSKGYTVIHLLGKQIWKDSKLCAYKLIFDYIPKLTMTEKFKEYDRVLNDRIYRETLCIQEQEKQDEINYSLDIPNDY
jgi:very-short-patch-repair endonuclease